MSIDNYGIETESFECICGSQEHTIKFQFHPSEDSYGSDLPSLYTMSFLSTYLPWYKRLWQAFKYVFKVGKPHRYGHFDVWEMKVEDGQRLMNMLVKYDKAHREHWEKFFKSTNRENTLPSDTSNN